MNDLFSYAETREEKVTAPAKRDNILTVSQLSNQLRLAVEGQFSSLAVEGEISGLKKAASGHIYFDLKDDQNLVKSIVWRSSADKLKLNLEDGQHVVVYGKLTTYGARSNYQMIVSRVELAGLGALMQKFEEMKARLEAEGLFDAAHKKEIPFIPNKIGIITSPTGAVIEDMLHRIRDRFPTHVQLYPVLVQGVGAKEQIAEGVRYFHNLPVHEQPDVIIVARGGGSLEDLWAFNKEIVVRAIFECSIPVISAVGHEPDVTLCDYVADLRAPTPTGAAEMVVPVRADLVYTLSLMKGKLEQATLNYTSGLKKHIHLLSKALGDPKSYLNQSKMRLDERSERFYSAFSNFTKLKGQMLKPYMQRFKLENWQQLQKSKHVELERLQKRLSVELLQKKLIENQHKLNQQHKLLESYSYEGPLKRGYAYVTSEKGEVVRKASEIQSDTLKIQFIDASVNVKTTK